MSEIPDTLKKLLEERRNYKLKISEMTNEEYSAMIAKTMEPCYKIVGNTSYTDWRYSAIAENEMRKKY